MTSPGSPRPTRRVVVRLGIALCTAILAAAFAARILAGWMQPLAMTIVAEGFALPTAVVGNGAGGLLVLERAGMIWTVDDGERGPFLDLTDTVLSEMGERGLFAAAVRDGRLFVTYTNLAGHTVLSEFAVDDGRAERSSERRVLTLEQVTEWHKGGGVTFGPDGMLYMGIGDDGRREDQGEYEQANGLRGVIVRLEEGKPQIVARGLRNPWRMAFDESGNLWIADVGHDSFEEVDLLPAGSNVLDYGWRTTEGRHCRDPQGCDWSAITLPVAEHAHADGDCAVIGGGMHGDRFVYGDMCSGRIRSVDAAGNVELLADSELVISSIGTGDDEMLYATDFASGSVYQLILN